jgi:hypothetical protein
MSKALKNYIKVYEEDLLTKILAKESKPASNHSALATSYLIHREISEYLRAKLIDWVLHCTEVCFMEEDNIFFFVV